MHSHFGHMQDYNNLLEKLKYHMHVSFLSPTHAKTLTRSTPTKTLFTQDYLLFSLACFTLFVSLYKISLNQASSSHPLTRRPSKRGKPATLNFFFLSGSSLSSMQNEVSLRHMFVPIFFFYRASLASFSFQAQHPFLRLKFRARPAGSFISGPQTFVCKLQV